MQAPENVSCQHRKQVREDKTITQEDHDVNALPLSVKRKDDFNQYGKIKYVLSNDAFLLCCSFLHESVRWLASQGRIEECAEIMADIARTNGKEWDEEADRAFKVLLVEANLEIST